MCCYIILVVIVDRKACVACHFGGEDCFRSFAIKRIISFKFINMVNGEISEMVKVDIQ